MEQDRSSILKSVQTPLGFFALVVLVVEAILGVVAAGSEGWDRTFCIYAMVTILTICVSIVGLLAYFKPEGLLGGGMPSSTSLFTEEESARKGIKAIIDSADIPMYFMDRSLVILFCNKPLATLADVVPSAIEGQHLSVFVDKIVTLAPEIHKAEFHKKQQLLIGKIARDFTDHCEEDEIIDNRNMAGNRYRGLNRIWISADKVYIGNPKRCIGIFVVYHVDPIKDPKKLQKFPQHVS